ncbi:unnamed protein product [Camellia sinensis]
MEFLHQPASTLFSAKKMSAYSTLELTLSEILRVVNPLRDDRLARHQIINELRVVVQSVESLRGATVEPFGSFASDLFTRWGDLDISIDLPNGLYISSTGKRRTQTLLGDLLRALRSRGQWRDLQFIASARVPILKFERNYLNISCDVSINNLSGQIKSKLLLWINEIDGCFRDMVLLVCSYSKAIDDAYEARTPLGGHVPVSDTGQTWTCSDTLQTRIGYAGDTWDTLRTRSAMLGTRWDVKEWAKAHGINDSKSGTFNSYTLSLLIIFHFQTCVPALLPPLKEIYPRNIVDDLIDYCRVRAVAERRIKDTCTENINKFRSNRSRRRNQIPLSELFISFLAKFSDISWRASEHVICPHTGRWEYIGSNMKWARKNFALFVEDPFEQPVNSARTVRSEQLTRISEAFQTTHRVLISGNQNRSSLITTLVGPQVSQYFPRTPLNNPIGYRTQPQVHRAVHSPSPSRVQHHFQNTRVDRHPNNNMIAHRTVSASHRQGQQARRPRYDI